MPTGSQGEGQSIKWQPTQRSETKELLTKRLPQSRTDGVSGLHHEALDVSVEDAAIVETTGRQGQEVLYVQTQRHSLQPSF